MGEAWRRFFQSRGGFAVAGVVGCLGVAAIVYAFRANFGATEAQSFTADRWFVDADTGKPFQYTVRAGDTIPVAAPGGRKSGYPAELCFWTRQGSVKATPTYVLLNPYRHVAGPTFCPDCGRLVVPHNPAPLPGAKPPPTKEEYAASHTSARR